MANGPPENRLAFFDDGEALFEAKKSAIRSAQKRVWIETFMILPDRTGRETIQLLAEAADRGVDVVLLFDQAGSHLTNLGFFRPVEEAGGQVFIFNPLPPWRRWGRRTGPWIRYRDHRKVMVADDTGFCGGHNFTSAYMGEPPHGYYDMSVRIDGPAVKELGRAFVDSVEKAGGGRRPLPDPPAVPGGTAVDIVRQDARQGERGVVETFRAVLDGATRSVQMVMAYFVPDRRLCDPILEAAARGVDVQIMTIGATDFPFVRWAGETAYGDLLRAGVRIFRLTEPKLHAKALVADGATCMVGSFDVNTFERRDTADIAAVATDPALGGAIGDAFRRALPSCREIRL
jgi:cardiolipin synthase A/B